MSDNKLGYSVTRFPTSACNEVGCELMAIAIQS